MSESGNSARQSVLAHQLSALAHYVEISQHLASRLSRQWWIVVRVKVCEKKLS